MAQIDITPQMVRQDGVSRIARSAGQSGGAGAVIVVGLWVAHQAGWRGDMPAEVVASLTVLLSTVAAWVSNRGRLRGES